MGIVRKNEELLEIAGKENKELPDRKKWERKHGVVGENEKFWEKQ